jgi:DNA-binding Xre family transcriptional regulator
VRTMQYQNARYRIGLTPVYVKRAPEQAPADWVAAAMDALDGIGSVVSSQCFANPDTLTPYGITAYALALMRLRECASAARFERLTDACDALAVTVSRLIEDRSCASREKCEALTRFVAHAQAMIQMSADHPASDGSRHVVRRNTN